MPKKTEEAQIAGTTYRVTQFGAVKAFEVMSRIGLGLTARDIAAPDLQWLREQFAICTKVGVIDAQGDQKMRFVDLATMYDEHFAGGPEAHRAMLQWLKFAAEVNFGPFADVLPAIVKGLRELLPSSSRRTSTGVSGGSSPATG